ncbi:MAG: hypothetical protein A2Y53_03755 [Chloroflexi bacterium RBG_16_47_49]|nr:MAG: hypothetical protein A2Y53_03755 [Chloroflexi bacterium RBG_16_47_49]
MAGFEYRGQINGAENPVLENLIIANSQTITIGDAISMSGGYVIVGTSSTRIYGVVVGIVTNKGIDLDSAKADEYDGTWTSSSNTYVATSDNVTDKKIRAVVCPDPYALWYNDSDGDHVAADLKLFIKLADEDQIDESETSATVGQFQVWKLDPDGDADASKGLYRIVSWQGDSFEPET